MLALCDVQHAVASTQCHKKWQVPLNNARHAGGPVAPASRHQIELQTYTKNTHRNLDMEPGQRKLPPTHSNKEVVFFHRNTHPIPGSSVPDSVQTFPNVASLTSLTTTTQRCVCAIDELLLSYFLFGHNKAPPWRVLRTTSAKRDISSPAGSDPWRLARRQRKRSSLRSRLRRFSTTLPVAGSRSACPCSLEMVVVRDGVG